MGVLEALGYAHPGGTWYSRALAVIASSRVGARVLRPVAHRVDALVLGVTGGRQSASSLLMRLPVLMVTCTGRRSGLPRAVPLYGIPVGASVALIGTNLGHVATPDWVHNLLAEPRARVSYRDRAMDVVSRIATPEEYEQAFAAAAGIYAGYAAYRRRISNRTVHVFMLEPDVA